MNAKYSLLHRLVDLLSPSSCCCCGQRLAQHEQFLCLPCQRHLPYTDHHLSAEDNDVARLFWRRIPIQKAATLYRHQPDAQCARIIYDIKYHYQPELARHMGKMMATIFNASGFFSAIDAIVPVPLTKRRQRERGYNQSQLLAEGMAEVVHLPVECQWLQRTTFVKSQTHLSHTERVENVEDAFRLTTTADLSNTHILLVDDVITTGATICACAQAMQAAHVRQFSVAALSLSKV